MAPLFRGIALAVSTAAGETLALLRSPPTSSLPLPLVRANRSFASSWTATEPKSPTTKEEKKTGARTSDRLSSVLDVINDRKLPPELRGKANAVRSETDIINVVEQRIWHSMEEGQFDNLPGKGKPLDLRTNPHADPAEDTLYRILSRNGCAPEWVELNKEIRSRIMEWRSALKKAWANKSNGSESKWFEDSKGLKEQMHAINDKVFRYNLIVPFGRQLFGLKWEKELGQLEG